MISKFSAGSAGDSILMNNSMQEAFDLTYIFCIPTYVKTTENPPYALKNTTHSIIIKGNMIEHKR